VAVAVIAVIGVFFLGMGIYALAAPAALIRPFGITLEQPTSRSEVRAVYGGFGLAIAAVLAYAAAAPEHRTGILITIGAALAGDGVRAHRLRRHRQPNVVLPELVLLPRGDCRRRSAVRVRTKLAEGLCA
jgi:hypothetical protein